jgi:hypothetical protein
MEEELINLLDWLLDNDELFDNWSRCKNSSEFIVNEYLNRKENE